MSVLRHYLVLSLRTFFRTPLATGLNVVTLVAGVFSFLTAIESS